MTTTNMGKVEVICSLLPIDGMTVIRLLEARLDLDTLFALHCRYQDLSKEQRADTSKLAVGLKANKLWRKFKMPLGYGESPWNWNWEPPHAGTASEIAVEFHAAVCRAVFRIPFLDFVKWSLGYRAPFVTSLFNAVCDVRDRLERTILDVRGTKEIYLEVEKVSYQYPIISKC